MRGLIAACALFVGGCAAAPYEYAAHSEIPRGPGMLTGASGSFSLRQPSPVPAADAEEYREFQEWRARKRQRQESRD